MVVALMVIQFFKFLSLAVHYKMQSLHFNLALS